MRSTLRIIVATSAVALIHSALASRSAKTVATRLVGERNRNAFYRPFYVAQSVVSFGALVFYLMSLPDRPIWRTGPKTAAVFNSVRFAALWAMVSAVNQIGWRRIAGLQGLKAWRAGDQQVPAEPEAQGPVLEGNPAITGPFRLSRHPLNFLGLPLIWLSPKMTRNWFTFNVLASAYLFLGSWHEEQRLRAAYGDKYARYQDQAAFFLGRYASSRRTRRLPSEELKLR